jgi:hypothetical protein
MMPGSSHEYIFGLHVAVKVAGGVDMMQTLNDLTKNGGDETSSKRAATMTRLDELI